MGQQERNIFESKLMFNNLQKYTWGNAVRKVIGRWKSFSIVLEISKLIFPTILLSGALSHDEVFHFYNTGIIF